MTTWEFWGMWVGIIVFTGTGLWAGGPLGAFIGFLVAMVIL